MRGPATYPSILSLQIYRYKKHPWNSIPPSPAQICTTKEKPDILEEYFDRDFWQSPSDAFQFHQPPLKQRTTFCLLSKCWGRKNNTQLNFKKKMRLRCLSHMSPKQILLSVNKRNIFKPKKDLEWFKMKLFSWCLGLSWWGSAGSFIFVSLPSDFCHHTSFYLCQYFPNSFTIGFPVGLVLLVPSLDFHPDLNCYQYFRVWVYAYLIQVFVILVPKFPTFFLCFACFCGLHK